MAPSTLDQHGCRPRFTQTHAALRDRRRGAACATNPGGPAAEQRRPELEPRVIRPSGTDVKQPGPDRAGFV